MVVAGVTRELVAAVHKVLAEPSVAQFEASFTWASAIARPGGVPAQVRIPADAAPLLDTAARLLRTSSYTPDEIITGPIVEVRHASHDPFGHISVQTMRRGRLAEARVRLSLDQLAPTFEWARDGRTVLVEGNVHRAPSQPLAINTPRRLHPLDEEYLSAGEASDDST